MNWLYCWMCFCLSDGCVKMVSINRTTEHMACAHVSETLRTVCSCSSADLWCFSFLYGFKCALSHAWCFGKTHQLLSCTANKSALEFDGKERRKQREVRRVHVKWSAHWWLSQDNPLLPHTHTNTHTWTLAPPLAVPSSSPRSFTDTWLTVMQGGNESLCVFVLCVLC